jgi:hypothetical protein
MHGLKLIKSGAKIKDIWKFDSQLSVKMHKSETKDQDEKDVEFWGW